MPDNCQKDCPVLPRVEALEEANKQHSKTHREIFERLRDTERDTAVQSKHMESIDRTMKEIKGDQKAILQKVETLEAKPGKRWDGLVDKLIFLVAGAVLAWVAAGAPGLGN